MGSSDDILRHLRTVADERGRREADPVLARRVALLKTYQQGRFRLSYADLLASERYRPAALFFLEELYGPDDFSERDAQFARIVPALVRLFPDEIVETVARLSDLHALSERLDSMMALTLPDGPLRRADYVVAWQATGLPGERLRQIDLILHLGEDLERYTRRAVLRHSLRAMRGPARAAGLGALQAFLERGFDTFRAMGGARSFLDTVAHREEALRRRLFEPDAVTMATVDAQTLRERNDPLGQLP